MLTAPLATLIVGLIGIAGVLATMWQRQRSEQKDRAQRAEHDARDQWWKRAQWAADRAIDPDNSAAQATGFAVLNTLSRSTLVTASERGLIRAVVAGAIRVDTGDDEPTEGGAQ